MARHRELKDEHDRQRVVRNGYRPERTIQTAIGAVAVKAPRARDPAIEAPLNASQEEYPGHVVEK